MKRTVSLGRILFHGTQTKKNKQVRFLDTVPVKLLAKACLNSTIGHGAFIHKKRIAWDALKISVEVRHA